MLILDYAEWNQVDIVHTMIPKAIYELSPMLGQADLMFQRASFEEPIVKRFTTSRGRPTIPLRVYLRLMFLKRFTGLCYDELVKEVTHNLMYRFFCRIPIERRVPDPTTLMRITRKYGEANIAEINRQLLKSLSDQKLLRSRKHKLEASS